MLKMIFTSIRIAICISIVLALASDMRMAIAQQPPPTSSAENAAPAEPAPADGSEFKITGLGSLREAIAEAQRTRRPILAVVGGESCPFCRVLAKEMRQEIVRKELARWTVAALDVERAGEDAAALTVSGIPALRLLTPAGKLVSARNGAMSADELVAWLQERFETAASLPSAELTTSGELTNLRVVRLVRELGRPDPTLREAAIRRLLASPQIAAPAVASAFAEGSLATRLSALELLTAWKAPVEGVDPWRPETITAQRLTAITAWAATAENVATDAPPTTLAGEAKEAAAEMIRQLLAADPAEATAIRERLARQGRNLLPLVYEMLQAAESDDARQRLTELRYRLVATDELALGWPGGLARLAATDAATRRGAVDELVGRTTAADEPLLLELFSDPEPLVRELSLRALHKAGGAKANSALVRLLDDPEPNVRAAVLKQLAEAPAATVVPRLAAYVQQEQDADLLVHAVRVLRAIKGKAAVACLMTLLPHENWRVRAEAADAIGEAVGESAVSDEDKADAYVALVELLKDDDTFVVSRAVQVLGKANLATVINPLAEVAARHPELAVEVVKALSHSSALKVKVAEHLQRFTGHEDPQVRAAAVRGLCEISESPLDVELLSALEDPQRNVRIAAAEGLFQMIAAEFSEQNAGDLLEESPSASPAADAAPPDEKPPAAAGSVLAADAPGVTLPPWMQKLEPPLRKLLAANSAEERLAAALPLIALGQRADAQPVLEAVVAADKTQAHLAAQALRWLPWQQRQALFTLLIEAARGPEDRAAIAAELAQRRHPEAAAQLWVLLARPDANGALTGSLIEALRTLYVGSRWYDLSSVPQKQLAAAVADCRPRATEGSRWQRLAALALLVTLEPATAVEIAGQLADQPEPDAALSACALQIALYADEKPAGQKRAVAALADSHANFHPIALRYLALGSASLQSLKEEGLDLPYLGGGIVRSSTSEAAIPEPPAGLTAEMLAPLLQSADPDQRLHAGSLLCLLGQAEGLPPLIESWNAGGRRDGELTRLVYRSIAALDDAAHVPLLAEIYQSLVSGEEPDYGDLSRFYWTIRNMSGPEILALRKRIRDEVGIENLRNDPFGGSFP